MTRIVHITPQNHMVGLWPGGKTRQIYIHPPGARYADKDFLFRISRVSVEQEESTFSHLPHYRRFLSLLKGKLVLSTGGREPLVLTPYDIAAFDGTDTTHTQGKATGFHLMLRKERCEGSLCALHMPESGEISFPPSSDTLALYCIKGAAQMQSGKGFVLLKQEEAVVVTQREEAIQMKALQSSAFFVVEITINQQ